MKKVIITYGAISALIIATLMIIATAFSSKIGLINSFIVGYASLVLSFIVIFFAVNSYYKNNPEVKVSFLKSLSIGLLITLIASMAYVIVWLIISYTVFPDYMDKYADKVLDKLRKSGATQAEINEQVAKLNHDKEMYKNPFYRAALTFLEPLPVGILISLISSGVMQLTKKSRDADKQK